jgi:hypothetical protein
MRELVAFLSTIEMVAFFVALGIMFSQPTKQGRRGPPDKA